MTQKPESSVHRPLAAAPEERLAVPFSRETAVAANRGPGTRHLVRVAAFCVIAWVVRLVVAGEYRRTHCIELLGHWLSIERTTNKLFCD